MDITQNTCYTYRKKRVPYEELTLADDFMFCKVMQNEELCKELLQRILCIPIEKIVYTDSQKVLDDTVDGKSVRLDVYVKDKKHTVYDIEMQTSNTKELPKRSRYYHACIDKSQLSKGKTYNYLTDTYVIFICTFDLFGKGLAKYSFDSLSREDPSIELQDGRHTIFVNTNGKSDVPKLQEVLHYLNTGDFSDDSEFLSELDLEVRSASKNAQWKEEYDMLIAREQVLREEGREEGRQEGRNEERIALVKIALTEETPETVSKMLHIPLDEVLKIKFDEI